ncbi:hypothetical protein KSS87_006595 [Heliosperma pusillum]|nr:hypothetical protein KSS87_006595 [Heliosperma pusillum]
MPLEKGDAAEETLVVMQKKLISKQNKPKTKKRPLEENVDTEETSPKKLKSSNKKKSNGDENKKMATLKPVVDDKMATNTLQTKCRPGQLVELINGPSKEQKEVVREIVFGGLLQLKMKKTEFIITKDDVHDIFLLPRGGNMAVLAQTGNTVSVTDSRLKKEWRLRFVVQNSSDPITVKGVFETLRGSNDSGDEFKKLFVLFSVSVLLAATSNKTIDLKLVRAVANVESIRAYDWCAYIFREMVNSIKVFKQGGKSIVSGYKPEAVRGTQNSDKGLDEELEEEVDEECESKEGYLMVKLPKGVESDKQIKARSIDGAHEIYLRMKRDNELFFSRYVNNMNKLGKMKPTKRNDEPSTSVHDEATEDSAAEEVVVNNEENPSAKQAPAPAPAPSLSQTQLALRDPNYHTFIEGLVARSYEKEKAKRGLPTFDIWTDMLKIQYKELNKKYGGCFDKDLFSDDDLECADEENDEEVDVTNLNSDDGGEAEKRNDVEECFDDFVTNIVLGVTSNIEHMYEDTNVVNQKDDVESNVDLGVMGATEYVPDEGNQNRDFDDGKLDDSNISAHRCISKYLLHSNVIPASAGMVPYHLGCTLDCGLPNEDLPMVSDFMLKNELFFAPVMQLRKEVMDYCFLNDHRTDKTKWQYKTAKDFLRHFTLKKMIDIDHDDEDNEHFFCVCIDFVREKLFYLDNRCYDDFNETAFAYMTDVVANTYAEYLVSKGTENAVKVKEFMMINVPFDWQTQEHDLDCGVFMMFHMMFFYGDIFDCELYNVQKRDLYRGEIAATLILSDFNGNRSEVLERVTRHNEMKGNLLSKRERINKKKTKGRAGKKNVQTPDSKIKDMVEDGPASVVGSSRRGKSDGLGCTFNCGMADDKVLLVSKFMRANQALFAKMLSTRKEVLDYCLLDDHNLSLDEVVAYFGDGRSLTRGDILSLRPTVYVNTVVIECWALILNHIEHTEKSETSLMFFGIGHMDVIHSLIEQEGKGDENKDQNIQKLFDTWDEFVLKNTVPCNWKADLIFVPMVWEDHYFCVCINFTREMVEVLDNTKYDQWEETIIYKAADLLEWFTDTSELVMKLSLTVLELVAFPVVQIKFNWQTYEENNIESGNFLMMHMIRYEGDIFEADLKSKVYRRYYWAEMAAAMLLATINEERANLIDKVKEFNLTKDEIWKEVKPKRGKTGTVKEKKGVAEEEVDKVDSFTKEKEDTIEMTRINTEIPILHNPPRQYHTIQGDIDDGQPKRVFKRYKRPAHSRGRGQSRGRGRGRNYSQ